MSSDNSLISSSTDAENLNPIHATSSGEGAPLPDRRKSMEDLSKEQLITMFQKTFVPYEQLREMTWCECCGYQ